MRKRTGLRNKYRTGRSTYSVLKKRLTAERYDVPTRDWNLNRPPGDSRRYR